MRLSRRDALAALGTAGVLAGATAMAGREPPRADGDARVAPSSEREGSEEVDVEPPTVATLTAAAEVLYPSRVEGHREFVEAYALARTRGRDDYRDGVAEAAAALDAAARDWYDDSFAALSRETRDGLLRELGTVTADADPDGALSERLRYYVVDELLFAFYASPPGGRLVGIENPVGYPGGTESYRTAPPETSDDPGTDGGADGD